MVTPRWYWAGVIAAALVGLGLMGHTAWSISATYDEVTYFRIASEWWRGLGQDKITRMGSPLLFWKLQHAPVYWVLSHCGRSSWVAEPELHEAALLPWLRVGSLWIWLIAFGVTVHWSRRLYGSRAMLFAAWLFALSPNLLAHGSLTTMEMPVVAAWVGACYCFWLYLDGGRNWSFWTSAVIAGVGFSCKFTAVLLPPLLGLAWITTRIHRAAEAESSTPRSLGKATWQVVRGMLLFVLVMLLTDFVVTGLATLPLSGNGGRHPLLAGIERKSPWVAHVFARAFETPIPQDWVGFATQLHHQRAGGPSYLFGARRMTGWWYYYFVALAVKTPLTLGLLFAARSVMGSPRFSRSDAVLPFWILAFLAITALGSTRNYGLRYLLPIAPLAIVWFSKLAEGGRMLRGIAWVGVLGAALATLSVHPNELTYFNVAAGGPLGGRRILSDSNLDWGQGLLSLARLQKSRPEFADLTLYYFGNTFPRYYGVVGTCHTLDAVGGFLPPPEPGAPRTRYVAVSASLAWGPWGPPGFFDAYRRRTPVAYTDDMTIAVYRGRQFPSQTAPSPRQGHPSPTSMDDARIQWEDQSHGNRR